MIKQLIVNGCSWTVDNELNQDPVFGEILNTMGLNKSDDAEDWKIYA